MPLQDWDGYPIPKYTSVESLPDRSLARGKREQGNTMAALSEFSEADVPMVGYPTRTSTPVNSRRKPMGVSWTGVRNFITKPEPASD